MKVAIITSERVSSCCGKPWAAVREGLGRCGHDVQIVVPGDWPVLSKFVDVVIMWNGLKGIYPSLISRFRSQGTAVVIAERGFFRRMQYTQFDHMGFNHAASWVCQLAGPSPDQGASRLFKVLGSPPARQMSRNDGYILVLGQMAGDAQLSQAQFNCSEALLQAVIAGRPAGMKVVFRPHPLSRRGRGQNSLCEDVRGARFCVTINSNSANEVIAMGCPVMAMGPGLFTEAMVALKAGLACLTEKLQLMADGWHVGDEWARNYLQHLACRQFNEAELMEGSAIGRILMKAIEDRKYVIHSKI